MIIKESERVNPIKIKDAETNHIYILDFNRESVQYAESQGFNWDLIKTQYATMVELLWYCAFRRYDRRVSREKAIDILEKLGGMRPEWLSRLQDLYLQSIASLIADPDSEGNEEDAKNAKLTLSLD